MKVKSLIVLAAVLSLVASAGAAPVEVKVDISSDESQPTLDGTWTAWRPWNFNPEISHRTINGIDCKFHNSHMDGGDLDPWWWWPYGGESGGDALIGDGYHTQSEWPAAPCWVYIGFEGLDVGVEYTLTAYMNLANVGGQGAAASISGSGGAAGGVAGGTGMVSVNAANYLEAGTATWTWTHSGGSADMQIDYSNGRGDIAGYVLTPEPVTLTLFGLGSLVLLKRRRV